MKKKLSFYLSLIMVLILSGCLTKSRPARVFVLSRNSLVQLDSPVKLQVDRVVFPDYLKRREFLLLYHEKEIKVNNFAYWAEPLQEAVKDSLNVYFRDNKNIEFSSKVDYSDKDAWKLQLDFISFAGNDKNIFVANAICLAKSGTNRLIFPIAFELQFDSAEPDSLHKVHQEAIEKLAKLIINKFRTNQL
mgnify:CR=1 FL=1